MASLLCHPIKQQAGEAAIIMQRLENNQLPKRLIELMQNFMNVACAEMDFVGKMAIANQWLFARILLKKMAKISGHYHAHKGSDGNNVRPQAVELAINLRILPCKP